MAKTLLELQQLLQRKTEELHDIFEKNKSDQVDERGLPTFDMNTSQLGEVKKRNEELDEINRELEAVRAQETFVTNQARMQDLKGIDRTIPQAGSNGDIVRHGQTLRSYDGMKLGDIVVQSNDYKFRQSSSKMFEFALPEVDVKTLISLSAGYAPPNYRTDLVVPFANRRPVVADLIPSDPTGLDVVKWMEQTTFTNNAAAVAEAALIPESAFVWTEQSSLVQKIGAWVPVTQEQVDDVPSFSGIINRDLTLQLQLVEETEILSGNGSSPHLDGFLHKSGVQTQAKSTDDAQDAIYKAFTLVRWTGFAEPSGVVMNPTDWQGIRLLRTTQGLYIFGDPSIEGAERVWGKPVIVTSAITQGTALTGDFIMYSHISRKQGIVVAVSDSHDVYFVYNKLAVRATMRESLEIKRAAAFAKITGL